MLYARSVQFVGEHLADKIYEIVSMGRLENVDKKVIVCVLMWLWSTLGTLKCR